MVKSLSLATRPLLALNLYSRGDNGHRKCRLKKLKNNNNSMSELKIWWVQYKCKKTHACDFVTCSMVSQEDETAPEVILKVCWL